jgi:hypothetical protein
MKVVGCLPTGKRCPPLKIPISVEALWIARRSESRWSTSRKKIAFWSDGAEPITGNHRHEVVGRPCAGRTLSQCDRSNPCEALWLGMSGRGCDRGRETQPDRGPSASQTRPEFLSTSGQCRRGMSMGSLSAGSKASKIATDMKKLNRAKRARRTLATRMRSPASTAAPSCNPVCRKPCGAAGAFRPRAPEAERL